MSERHYRQVCMDMVSFQVVRRKHVFAHSPTCPIVVNICSITLRVYKIRSVRMDSKFSFDIRSRVKFFTLKESNFSHLFVVLFLPKVLQVTLSNWILFLPFNSIDNNQTSIINLSWVRETFPSAPHWTWKLEETYMWIIMKERLKTQCV